MTQNKKPGLSQTPQQQDSKSLKESEQISTTPQPSESSARRQSVSKQTPQRDSSGRESLLSQGFSPDQVEELLSGPFLQGSRQSWRRGLGLSEKPQFGTKSKT